MMRKHFVRDICRLLTKFPYDPHGPYEPLARCKNFLIYRIGDDEIGHELWSVFVNKLSTFLCCSNGARYGAYFH